MNQKVKEQGFLKFLWLLHTPKRLIYDHLLGLGSGNGSDQKGPDPQQWLRHLVPVPVHAATFCSDWRAWMS
jgi:hypothetical protein